jgi:hypothetical protein
MTTSVFGLMHLGVLASLSPAWSSPLDNGKQ